ncbi:MAG: tungstate ABC transporter substrate-binding protein WtpA [Geobacteraceae bacterium]|nr:tungstate ABC transporter substrate-binding protein WtpA [Geobacteraceae bacterium]
MKKVLVAALFLMLNAFLLQSPALAEPSGKLILFHAGSLTVPFAAMEKEFEARYPKIDVQREAGGSTRMARLISEVGKPADLMASADFLVIDQSLIPAKADFDIRFATNELVLAYTDQSRFAKEIDGNNWFSVLSRRGVRWGHSDPNVDPGGYRSLMVMQLAERYYKKPGLYQRLLENRPLANLRDKAVSLTALLQNGDIDYIWTYRSLALQHQLRYLSLDPHINLSDPANDAFYRLAKVRVTGEKPGTYLNREGRFVAYGITLLKDAPNAEAALLFLGYLLDPQGGQKVLARFGQPPFDPPFVTTTAMWEKLPVSLRKRVAVRK